MRLLLILLIFILLLGAGLGVFWFIGSRRASAPGTGDAATATLPATAGVTAPFPTTAPLTPIAQLSLGCPERWGTLADSDADGLPDEVEVLYATNPQKGDTDGDSYRDGEEVRGGYDPLQAAGNPRLDSDGDGLPEPEECQWKTDTHNPDTDGDSFQDGGEVRNGFDPTIRGDGKGSDALPERRAQEAQASLDRFRPNPASDNLTERLAAQLFGDRPASELSTFSPSPEQIQTAVSATPVTTALPDVALTDIAVSQSNTPPDVSMYLATVRRAEPLRADATTLGAAFQAAFRGDPSILATYRSELERFDATLRAIPVPPTAVPYHRTLAGFVRFTVERFRTVEAEGVRDPVRAYLALRELQAAAPQHAAALERLRKELESLASATATPAPPPSPTPR